EDRLGVAEVRRDGLTLLLRIAAAIDKNAERIAVRAIFRSKDVHESIGGHVINLADHPNSAPAGLLVDPRSAPNLPAQWRCTRAKREVGARGLEPPISGLKGRRPNH